MKTKRVSKSLLIAVILVSLVAMLGSSVAVAQGDTSSDIVKVNISASSITWVPAGGANGMTLTITGPNGYYFRQEFGGRATFSSRGLADGSYFYEVVLSPGFSQESGADQAHRGLGLSPDASNMVQSGGFTVLGGSFVTGGVEASSAGDVVNADDLIVQGSLCVGFDCVNNENFGFDTIRLKENNLRIGFNDTSVGSFPSNDWTIVANDSASGGVSFLAFEDVTGAKFPFKVVAGAPTNSLFVSSTGNLGLGTGTPVLDIHANTSDTPAIRLEQNSSGGYTAQTWDIAGNEANFFIRDVTGGSRLSFRIRPGAPTSSIDIAASGNVGIGTASPDFDLDVENTAAVASIGVTNTTGASVKIVAANAKGIIGTRNLFNLEFVVNDITKMTLATNGALTVLGPVNATAFNVSSDRNAKEKLAPVDRAGVLERLSTIPISTWNFIEGDNKVPHMGPMAQDFYAAFGLGMDDKHISTVDADGVAFAAIQELTVRNKELAERVSVLEANGSPSGQPSNGMIILVVFLSGMNLSLIAWLVWSNRRGARIEIKRNSR